MAGAIASFGRIQNYLASEEKDDNRTDSIDEPGMSVDTDTEKRPFEHSLETSAIGMSEKCPPASISSRSGSSKSLIVSAEGCVSWPESARPVLDVGPIEVRRHSFMMVLGPVGCGKSMLLNVFLGEMPRFQGTLRTTYNGVAYCAQDPFIPSMTCREVILGYTPYEATWYEAVVKACALDEDFQKWPKGGESPSGGSGLSLSGGQKQRLALARAVYSKKEFVILDDSFGGLDAATEDQVFHNLLGEKGLLRSSRRTVILTASSVRRAPYADTILLMGSDGNIVDQGTFTDLRLRSTMLSTLSAQDEDLIQKEKKRAKEKSGLTEVVDDKARRAMAITKAEETQLNRRTGDASVYGYYLKSAGAPALLTFSVCLVVLAFCDTFPSKSRLQLDVHGGPVLILSRSCLAEVVG